MSEIVGTILSEGQLSERALADVLYELGRHRATGILTIQGETDILAISLLEGKLVSTDSLNRTLEEGLGDVLEAEGWVTPENYASLASEYRAGGGRVVDLLVERSFVSERQLGAALRQHIYQLGLDAFRWQGGEFKFYPGDEVSYESCVRPIGVEEFAVRASRDLGAIGPLDGDPVTRETPYRRVPDLPPMRDENTLAPAERWLLHELGEPATIGALADRGEFDEFEVIFYAWRLERRGLLQRGAGGTAKEPEVLATPPTLGIEDAPQVGEPSDPPLEPMADVIELPRLAPMLDEPEARDPEPVVAPLEVVEPPAPSFGGAVDVEMPDPVGPHSAAWQEPPQEEPAERAAAPRRSFDLAGVTPWVARAIAAIAAVLLVAGLFRGDDRTVLPYPWQGSQRADLAAQREAAQQVRIEDALTSYFLIHGRFPDSVESLVAEPWARRRDFTDSEGRPFRLAPTSSTYVLQSEAGEDERRYKGSVIGNFLLDPNLAAFTDPGGPSLVLLD